MTALWMAFGGVGWIWQSYMTEYWHLYVIYVIVMYCSYTGGGYRMSYTAVNRWFMDRRAFAVTFVTMGGGLGSIFMVPLAAAWIEAYGWQTASWIAGISILAIAVPISWLYPQGYPEDYGLHLDNTSPEERQARAEQRAARRGRAVRVRPALADITTRQALTSFTFWMLVCASVCTGFAGAPVNNFQNMRMGALGYSIVEAAAWMGLRGTFTYIGRFLVMFFGDWSTEHIGARWVMGAIYIGRGIAFLPFAIGSQPWHFFLWAVVEGSIFGASVPYAPVLMGAYFGRQAFGFIYGIRTGLAGLGGFISPLIVGYVADQGSWEIAFLIVCVGYIIGGLMVFFAYPPKQQTREQRGAAT